MTELDNPNEYDDDAFTKAAIDADSAIVGMWEAGADLGNITDTIANALANAGIPTGTLVTVQVG